MLGGGAGALADTFGAEGCCGGGGCWTATGGSGEEERECEEKGEKVVVSNGQNN